MQDSKQPSAAELREELSPVSERFVAVETGDETVVFDTVEPDGWILSDTALDRAAMR